MTLQVAIIGAGPAGYYTAEALAKSDDVHVDIIDRLPTPYGLIRFGVAPDHQSIKNVSRRYEKTNLKDNVRFVGHMDVGTDVSLDELHGLYDAIVLAVGAPLDREIGLSGEDAGGVIGSARFVGWYNGHPDHTDLAPDMETTALAVIGNGNVALDVARIVAKTAAELKETDLAPQVIDRIATAPLRDIYILGRRGPLEAAFSTKELGEFGALENAVPLVDPAQLPTDLPDDLETRVKKNLAILETYTHNTPDMKPLRIHLRFYTRPVAVLGDDRLGNDRLTGLRLEKTRVEDGKCVGTGETYDLACGLVVPCIGYRSVPLAGAPFHEGWGVFQNDDGRVAEGLYAVGWAKRGPSGTIGTNKPDGIGAAKRILAEVTPAGKAGREGLDRLAAERGIQIVTFRDWQKIDEAEIQAADGSDAPRQKFQDVDEMLRVVLDEAGI